MSIIQRLANYTFGNKKRFLIIGSGPAGMYTAKYLLESFKNSKVTILEANSYPYGLLSHGVSPDNLPIKTIEQQFNSIAKKLRMKLNHYFPINYDKLRTSSLKNDAVFLATGCESPLRSSKTLTAIDFVKYINGYTELHPDIISKMQNSKTINILGLGNVSLDVARLITLKRKYIENNKYFKTEIKEFLYKLNPNQINIIGRKSPFETRFGVKELKELKEKSMYKLTSNWNFNSKPSNKVAKFLSDLPGPTNNTKCINFKFNVDTETSNYSKNEINIESFGFKQKNSIDVNTSNDNKYILTDDMYRIAPFKNVYAIGWAQAGARGNLSDTILSVKHLVSSIRNES